MIVLLTAVIQIQESANTYRVHVKETEKHVVEDIVLIPMVPRTKVATEQIRVTFTNVILTMVAFLIAKKNANVTMTTIVINMKKIICASNTNVKSLVVSA